MKRFLKELLIDRSGQVTRLHPISHTYVIGQPGTGKSRALESWIIQDVLAGNGVAVIDPHGDLFQNLLARIAMLPQIWPRVVILDPCNPVWTVSFNPLKKVAGLSNERVAHHLTDVVIKIWKLDTATSPRMLWLLHNTFLALADLELSLLDLPRFLSDSGYRESLLPGIKSSGARIFFSFEYPKNPGAIHQWVTPILNKLGSLIYDPDISLMLGAKSSIDFRQVLDQKLILLVNIPKGILGEAASALLGAFLVAHVQKAALSRANSQTRQPYYLYLDEFQNYTTDNIQDILSESRKYTLSLTLAHQYLDQLSPNLSSAVLNTAGTMVCFRVGYQDAYRLVKEIFPSSNLFIEQTEVRKVEHLGSYSYLSFAQEKTPLGWEGLAKELTRLPNREFWLKRRGNFPPVHQHTFNMDDLQRSPEVKTSIQELIEFSGNRYGRLKEEVCSELAARRRNQNQPFASTDTKEDDFGIDENSIWGR